MEVLQRAQPARLLGPLLRRHCSPFLLGYCRHRAAPFCAGAFTTPAPGSAFGVVLFFFTAPGSPSVASPLSFLSLSFLSFAAMSLTVFSGSGLYPLNTSNWTAPGANIC